MRRTQRGVSVPSVMLWLMIGFLALKVISVILPVYYEYYTVTKVIHNLMNDLKVENKNPAEMQSALESRFQVNSIKLPMTNFQFSRDDGNYKIVLDYEVRQNFIANLDVVEHFSKTFESKGANAEN